MNPILIVIPYHNGDFEIAKKLVEWIAELGNCLPHSILFCADSAVPLEKARQLMDIARPHFNHTSTMICAVPPPTSERKVWPPNFMFLDAAKQVHETSRFDFLWLEPDAIPLSPVWLRQIAFDWHTCPRRFMGSIVKQQGQLGLPAEYLNGVAMYPNNAIELFDKIESVKNSSQAFDVGSASAVIPRAENTPLIQHFWGEKDLPPVFVESKNPDSPKNHVTLDFISKDAVVFHRSKDGKLIDLLRKKLNTPKPLEPSGESKTVVIPELAEIPKSPAPVVDMMPGSPNEVAPEHSEQIKRGPGRPKKSEVSA